MTVATGLVVTLNPDLQPTTSRSRSYGGYGQMEPEHVARSLVSILDRNTVYDTLRLPDFGNAEWHGSLMHLLADGYSNHRPISFAPHDLWYVLLTEIAQQVNKSPDTYRHLFTRQPEGKLLIAVLSLDPSELPLEAVEAELRRHVPVDLAPFLPAFSTHTDESRLACIAAFADAVKSYYGYGTLACGLPAVEFRGTKEDWELFADSARNLGETMKEEWLARPEARARQIAGLFDGGDQDFVKDVFRTRNVGSGGQLHINGWFATDFFRRGQGGQLESFPNTWSSVPFHNIESGRRFVDGWGCFAAEAVGGFLQGRYGRITYEERGPRPLEPWGALAGELPAPRPGSSG